MRPLTASPTWFNAVSQLPIVTELGGHRAELLYCGVLGGKWWRNYLHVHSFFEVCHVYDGAGTFTVAGEKHALSPGQTFLAMPGKPHEIVSDRRKPLGVYFWAYTLAPARQPNAERPTEAALFELLGRFRDAQTPVVAPAAIGATLKLICDEMARRAPGFLRVITGLTEKLIIDTARAVVPAAAAAAEHPELRGRTATESLVQTAARYLQDNLARRFEVRDVAAQVGLSERQLSRVFNKATGSSILAYLTRARVERAAHLLLNSDMPIKQISAAVGYPDTHYFTTLFGRHTGQTPAAFRRSGGTRYLRDPDTVIGGERLPPGSPLPVVPSADLVPAKPRGKRR